MITCLKNKKFKCYFFSSYHISPFSIISWHALFESNTHDIFIYLSRKIHPLKFLALHRDLIPIRSMTVQVYFEISFSVYQLTVWQCFAKCISLFPFSLNPYQLRVYLRASSMYNFILLGLPYLKRLTQQLSHPHTHKKKLNCKSNIHYSVV